MLNNLFATLLICLGVANTTPISNYDQEKSNQVLTTPKKQNETANYQLQTQVNDYTQNTFTTIANPSVDFGDPYVNRIEDQEKIQRITGNNAYINVIGDIYQARFRTYLTTDQTTLWSTNTTLNKAQYDTNVDYDWKWTSRLLYFYKITTYNFNVETRINLYNAISIEARGSDQITGIYMKKTVWTINNDTRLDQLLGRTSATPLMAYETKEEIINVNNGFYYTETTTIQDLNRTSIVGSLEDETEINLLPNANNYIVIQYQPMVSATPGTPDVYKMICTEGNIWNYTAPRITGTNIIPSGTYEIVDIPGLMFEVIGLPFAFVSQAFNLTLFPGTPYQINIANLFLSIFAIIIFVWLLLLFIKMKAK